MGGVARILVVDDEAENIDYVVRVLSSQFEVISATNGADAVEILDKHDVAAVISDQRMPGLSGVAVLEHAFKTSPHTGRIMLTGYADFETTVDAINLAHIHGFLRKPVSPAEVSRTVKMVLDVLELRTSNRKLVQQLERQNQDLQESKRLLELSLDEKTRELLRSNERLQELAVRDGLTGLYNHRHFQQRAEEEISRAQRHDFPVSLVFLDLDHFKIYNDTNGHPQGDEALRQIADLMRLSLRQSDVKATVRDSDIAARYGGEEFVVLLPHTHAHGARVVADRIRESVEEMPFVGEEKLPGKRLTVSLGIASFPGDANSRAGLIEVADQRLYAAKVNGRNCVVGAG